HPDLLPTTQDLDDPLGYSERRHAEWTSESTLDEALSRILDEGIEGTETSESSSDSGSDSKSESGSESDGDEGTDDSDGTGGRGES
ncbi:MAG: zinc-dependent metalloprotease, partial [Brevibacterium aurantiacum]|nr:zinc-dependent metalloprotease [Brevibacterium aurantiacum]